jgi:hypothetical protein
MTGRSGQLVHRLGYVGHSRSPLRTGHGLEAHQVESLRDRTAHQRVLRFANLATRRVLRRAAIAPDLLRVLHELECDVGAGSAMDGAEPAQLRAPLPDRA